MIAIDQVELDEPRVRAVVRDGQLANLPIKRGAPRDKNAPIHLPFDTFALTDASIDLDLEGTRLSARSLDLDDVVRGRPTGGRDDRGPPCARVEPEVHRRARDASRPRRPRTTTCFCSIEARVRVEPGSILVRRLEGVGSADLDGASGTTPPCDLPADDKRRVELSLGHVRVVLPAADGGLPDVEGHVRVRAPIALAERAATLPETDGWVGLDADVRYAPGMVLPEVSGAFEAHDVRLLQYSFAKELHSTFTLRQNVVVSPSTTLRFAGGEVTLTDTVVDPLAAKLERTKFDAKGIDFTALLRDLGVHKSSWVGWDIHEVHVPTLSGTFVPLHIDGELTARTSSFGVPATGPPRTTRASASSASRTPRSRRTSPSGRRRSASRTCSWSCRARASRAPSCRSASTTSCASRRRASWPTSTTCPP